MTVAGRMEKSAAMEGERCKSSMSRVRRVNSFRRIMEMCTILVIGMAIGTVSGAPLGSIDEKTFADLPSKKGHDEEVGNPSELAWQAWLLVDGQPNSQLSSGFDSASLLRKITPKSIFVAPELTVCADGYQADTMNRCVKDVSIDSQAHLGFLIERLNAKYAGKQQPSSSSSFSFSSSSSSSSSQPTGPLQLSIPLIMSGSLNPIQEAPKSPLENDSSNKASSSASENEKIVETGLIDRESNKSQAHDTVLTVYELDDDGNGDEASFGNKSTGPKENAKMPQVHEPSSKESSKTPIGPIIVDYEVPAAIEKLFNRTTSDDDREDVGDEEDAKKDGDASPTVVLLLSPTKLPAESLPGSSDVIVAHNSSLGQVIIKVENVTGNVTGKEIIRLSVPENFTSTKISRLNVSRIEADGDEKMDTDFGERDENDETEDNEEYPRDESTEIYEDNEDLNYEDATEVDDEILKHSEAGMTVTLPGIDETLGQRTTSEYDKKNWEKASDNGEATGSSEISSEVSINGDFVRETTLVDFNVSKTSSDATGSTIGIDVKKEETVTTPISREQPEMTFLSDDIRNDKRGGHFPQNVDLTVKDLEEDEKILRHEDRGSSAKEPETVHPVRGIEDLEESPDYSSTEKTDSGETMIAASTNDASVVLSREIPKFQKNRRVPGEEATTIPSGSSKSQGMYNYETRDYETDEGGHSVDDDSQPVIRTLPPIEEPYRPSGSYDSRDYVRFPNYDEERGTRVRFPSDDANSISNDYKDRNRRPYTDQRIYDEGYDQVAMNVPDVRQRETYWWLPNGWRDDRRRENSNQRTRSDQRDRSPMLLRFWTRMPLVRDPSFAYPTRPTLAEHRQGNSRVEGRSLAGSTRGDTRRVRYYKEMSNREINRALGRDKRAVG